MTNHTGSPSTNEITVKNRFAQAGKIQFKQNGVVIREYELPANGDKVVGLGSDTTQELPVGDYRVYIQIGSGTNTNCGSMNIISP